MVYVTVGFPFIMGFESRELQQAARAEVHGECRSRKVCTVLVTNTPSSDNTCTIFYLYTVFLSFRVCPHLFSFHILSLPPLLARSLWLTVIYLRAPRSRLPVYIISQFVHSGVGEETKAAIVSSIKEWGIPLSSVSTVKEELCCLCVGIKQKLPLYLKRRARRQADGSASDILIYDTELALEAGDEVRPLSYSLES